MLELVNLLVFYAIKPIIERLTVDDLVFSGKKGTDVWGGTSYKLPEPYLRPRIPEKKGAEDRKSTFVPAPGDGPQYKFTKAKKGMDYQIQVFGKDGKEPPISYLELKPWIKKKEKKAEEKTEDKTKQKGGRGSFIDAIFFYGEKYKFPGPDKYFSEKKKEEKKKDSDKPKDEKKPEKPNFLDDYQYLGLNNPAPGTYNMKDHWVPAKGKEKKEEKKKPAYVPNSWRTKNDKGQAPGQYEITRLMTIAQAKEGEETKGKPSKRFASIPVFERPKFGIINKVFFAKF